MSAPITYSFKGKNVINNDYYLNIGGHGGIGTSTSKKLTEETDLLIIIGSSCSMNTRLPTRPAIQIDIDPMVIGRRFPIDISLVGNAGEILPKLLEKVEKSEKTDYLEKIASLKEEWMEELKIDEDPSKTPLRYAYIMNEISKQSDDDAIITIDVGENAWRFGRNFPMKDTQKHLLSGYLATMGFGLPSALISQIDNPEKQVICITGDGGFTMVMGDFLTAVKYKLPVKVFLFNNHEFGMIMDEQKRENYPNWNTHLYNCDFSKYAEDCGATGFKVKTSEELKIAIKNALKTDGPVIVDIETDANS
ncbi:thiamine pyrophosphate-dependent enzyme [Methanobrevibacter sp. OttesenSCG-928-K11]|nr:thiamine pyrophosphate-dependent enzyme [Methanobrevibacter sp. OttesenSCG-928-K11]MDL2271246.1 thiamine pyrophosphate-dependent enzyme [Methanobrevibacter sp. OttesenSCG-928-I08]